MEIATIPYKSVVSNSGIMKPNYHLNYGKKRIEKALRNNKPFEKLEDVTASVYTGGIFKRVFVEDEKFGLPYISAQHMMNSNPLDVAKIISKKYTPRQNDMTLRNTQILVSCAGTVGNVRLISEDLDGIIGSQDIIRVLADSENIPYGFIYAYLASPTAYNYIQSFIYGSVVPRISPDELGKLPVPILPKPKQQQIHNLVVEASNLRKKANLLLKSSIDKLNDEFKIKLDKKVIYGTSSISNILNNYQNRLNSPTYINQGVASIEILKSKGIEFKSLKQLNFVVTRPGIFKRVKVKGTNGLPYIKGSELNKVNPFTSCEYLSKTKTPFLDELKLYENQILFTCAGTVGEIKLISKEFEEYNAIGSQDIIRIDGSNSDISIFYLFAYLKTEIISHYIQSLKYGSVIERVEPFHVDMVPIYVPDENLLNEVENSVLKFKQYLYDAFTNEQKAINLIENEIEQWQTS